MPVTYTQPTLIVYRSGQARLSDLARRALLGTAALHLAAPGAVGSRWLLLPVSADTAGALLLNDDRGQKRFTAHALAAALFAWLPAEQRNVQLLLQPAPAGFWLVPVSEMRYNSELPAQAA